MAVLSPVVEYVASQEDAAEIEADLARQGDESERSDDTEAEEARQLSMNRNRVNREMNRNRMANANRGKKQQ